MRLLPMLRLIEAKPSAKGGSRAVGKIGSLPAATLVQRLASMSDADLMRAARELASKSDLASEKAAVSVLEELERRMSSHSFETFVASIYPLPGP